MTDDTTTKADSPPFPSWQSTFLCRALFLTLLPSLSAARSEAQTLKGREQRKPTFISPWRSNTCCLSCADSQIREPKWPPVGRAITTVSRARSSLGGRRKSQGWNGGLGGRKKRLFGVRLLGTPRLPTRPGDSSTHDSLTKNFGVGRQCQDKQCKTMQNLCHACEKSCKTRYYSRPYIHVHPALKAFFQRKTV